MGYSTEFIGKFKLGRRLTDAEARFLRDFATERHGGATRHYAGFPGFWCQWVPSADGRYLEWDGAEKFYNYGGWLRFLVDNFLEPKGIPLEGEVLWRGEDPADTGCIVADGFGVKVVGDGEGDGQWSSEGDAAPESPAELARTFLLV